MVPTEEIWDFFRKKKYEREKRLDEIYLKASNDAKKIIQHIANKYKPLRIIQWGSLINRKNFCEFSDIDIAVEGICNPQDFFALLGEVWELTDFPVDIVQLEKIEPAFAKIILQKGKVVYERCSSGSF